jgi:hypothetical protein
LHAITILLLAVCVPRLHLSCRGSHWYILEPLPNGHTRFVHGAEMMGLAIPFLGATMRATLKGYQRFNQALADEVMHRCRRQPGKRAVA